MNRQATHRVPQNFIPGYTNKKSDSFPRDRAKKKSSTGTIGKTGTITWAPKTDSFERFFKRRGSKEKTNKDDGQQQTNMIDSAILSVGMNALAIGGSSQHKNEKDKFKSNDTNFYIIRENRGNAATTSRKTWEPTNNFMLPRKVAKLTLSNNGEVSRKWKSLDSVNVMSTKL